MKKFKITALILVLAMCALAFAACADPDDGAPDAPPPMENDGRDIAGGGDPGGDQNGGADAGPARAAHNVQAEDFGGYVFTVLVSVNGELAMLNDFEAEELTGDVINDAIFMRNALVEEKFNVTISNFQMPTADGIDRPAAQTRIRNMVAAGDSTYDAVMIGGYGATSLAQSGHLMDLSQLEPIDLSRPWWDQMANRDLRIMDRMFFTTGAISNVVNRATYAVLFNKQVVADYGLDDPYQMVRDGTWTYEALIQMANIVTADLDGDGNISFEDRVGALVWDDTMMGVVNSIGERAAIVNAQGEIEITLFNERTLRSFDTFMDFVMSPAALTYQREDWESIRADAMFENSQALFYMQIMELVVRLRAMEIDFGVLPSPKLDVYQPYFHSTVGAWHSGFLAVPIGQPEPHRTASILEVMAAESVDTLLRAYYEIALVGQLIRDDESEEMLDIIFSTRVFDVGWLFQIGGWNEAIMNQLRIMRRDFVSMYERARGRADREVQQINDSFADIIH